MGKSFTSKYTASGTLLYKNSPFSVKNPKRVSYENIIYLPNYEDIIDQFSQIRMTNGNPQQTSEKIDVYVKLYNSFSTDSELSGLTSVMPLEQIRTPLNFGDSEFTMFTLDESCPIGILNRNDTYNKYGVYDTTSIQYNNDQYSFSSFGYFATQNRYGISINDVMNDYLGQSRRNFFNISKFLLESVSGEKVKGLSYLNTNEGLAIPYNYTNTSWNDSTNFIGINFNKESDGKALSFGCSYSTDDSLSDQYVSGFNSGSSDYPSGDLKVQTYSIYSKTYCMNDVFDNFNRFNIKTSTQFGGTYQQYSTNVKGILLGFLTNSTKDELWCLSASFLGVRNSGMQTIVYNLMKVSDAFAPLDETVTIDVNATLLSILSPYRINWGDDAPDITGPGDPYGEIDNVDEIVGGQDINVDKDLNNIDTTPNTDYERFALASGLFGAYSLEPADLQRYTKTLSALYSHSNDILFGEANGVMADRISNSVTSLIMLPLEIPSNETATDIFSLGNTGIMGDGSWGDYIIGNNWANAKYLIKFTKDFIVELGTIDHNYDNFLDFAPYSSASLFIPYVGKVELPINLIQSTKDDQRPLTLNIRVNYTSGDLIAILTCEIKGKKIPLCTWNGNCARAIKVSVNDDSEAIRAGANRIVSMFSASAGAGFNSAISSGGGTTATNYSMNNGKQNSYYGESSQAYSGGGTSTSGAFTVRSPSMPTSVTSNQHMIGNGSTVGDLGFMGIQKIVLTVERPVWWRPYDYGDLIGYPTKKIATLSSVEGFAKVTDAHIRCSATSDEKEEIASLLGEGVIF